MKKNRVLYRKVKRAFDIVVSGVGIVMTSPLWVAAAIGIELSDPGPIFYKANRVGINNEPFLMYKFRSMRVDKKADEKQFKADTTRIFKWGAFMRSSKIDELPQLINIFKGDMSVVGPRPAAKDQVEIVRGGKYNIASGVLPGLTGPAALYDYIYGDTIEDEAEYEKKVLPTRMKLDVYYVRKMNVLYDLKMIWWTVVCIVCLLSKRKPEKILNKLLESAKQVKRMQNRLKVIVMTQNDRFFIPKNIYKASLVCDLIEIVEVDCKSSLDNKIGDYYKWFGFTQCAKMGIVTVFREFQKYIDRLCGYKIFHGFCSVRDVAKATKVPYRVIKDSNDERFVKHVRKLQPDLIISYSAPQIIKKYLLEIPKYGVINVHGSLLPDYRGTLPSFWYLYNDEKTGGATVHYMSAKIDDGSIIVQDTVDISDCRTMFQLMKKTKGLGGELMVQAIKEIGNGTVTTRPNETDKGRYFTWPTAEQAKQFMEKGYRLI